MLKHKTIPPGTDQPGFTGVTPSLYAEEHLFSGGTHGALMYRDTGASDGSGWATSSQGILVSAGALEIPSFTTTLGFALTVTGAVTLSSTLAVTGAVTGGTYNGQTISSAASFTGTLAVAGNVTGGTYNGQTLGPIASFTGGLSTTSTLVAGTILYVGTITGSAIQTTATNGLQITPKAGSTNDISLLNPLGSVAIFRVPTGTNNLVLGGDTLYLSGSSGTILKTDATNGYQVTPKAGSSYDLTFLNPAGSGNIMRVPTGTLTAQFGGAITTVGSITSGTSVVVGGAGTGGLLGYASDAGLYLRGRAGSVYDFAVLNPGSSAYIIYNPTGTLNVGFGGAIVVATSVNAADGAFTAGVSVGTNLAVTGVGVFTAGVRSSTTTLAIASATPTTLVALTSGDLATYIVRASLGGPVNDASNYAAAAIICVDGTTANITTLESGALMAITLSGLNVQVTQTSGSLNSVKVVLLRIA